MKRFGGQSTDKCEQVMAKQDLLKKYNGFHQGRMPLYTYYKEFTTLIQAMDVAKVEYDKEVVAFDYILKLHSGYAGLVTKCKSDARNGIQPLPTTINDAHTRVTNHGTPTLHIAQGQAVFTITAGQAAMATTASEEDIV
jgi:hypothetical protein